MCFYQCVGMLLSFGIGVVALSRPAAAQLAAYSSFGPIFQGGKEECGPQCLYVASRILMISADYTRLASTSGLNENGTSLLGLKHGAESIGLKATGAKLEIADWRSIEPLSILHLKEDHFVLAPRAEGGGLRVFDPGKGKVIMLAQDELAERWSGYLLHLELQPSTSQPSTDQLSTITTSLEVNPADKLVVRDFAIGSVWAERHYPFEVQIGNAGLHPLKFRYSKN